MSTTVEMVPPKKSKQKLDRNHITLLPGNPEMYKCNVCEKIFRNKKSKCYHDACVTGVKPYKCNRCEQAFVKRSHFEYHERVHTGYKPFKCSLCDKAFPQKNKLNRHMLSHKQEKPFLCLKCGKHYAKRDDLLNHMSIHTGQTPHVCKICGKSFRIMTNLNRHMHTHSSERPYACDLCGKSFKEKSLLSRHRRTHGNERPFSCAHCTRFFLSKSELCRHLTIHTDIKPFSCTYCDTVFRRKDNLNRHIRHHHADGNANCNDSSKQEKAKNNDSEKCPEKSITAGVGSVSAPTCSKPVKKTRGKKSLISPLVPSITNPSIQHANRRVNSRDESSSRIDSLGNITPIIRGPGELSNAVPVINGPISATSLRPEDKSRPRKKTFTYTEPIPLAEAVVINRRIEEKLYPQSSKSTNNYYFFRKHSNIGDGTTLSKRLPAVASPSHNLAAGKATIVTCNRINIATSLIKRREPLSSLHSVPSKLLKIESHCRATNFNDRSNIVSNNETNGNRTSSEKTEAEQRAEIIIDNRTFLPTESTNCVPTITINGNAYLHKMSNPPITGDIV